MTRDELIEAGAKAHADYYGDHSEWDDLNKRAAAAVLGAVEPLIREEERRRNHVVMVFRMDRFPQIELFGPETYEDCCRSIDQGNLRNDISWILELKELPLSEDEEGEV